MSKTKSSLNFFYVFETSKTLNFLVGKHNFFFPRYSVAVMDKNET